MMAEPTDAEVQSALARLRGPVVLSLRDVLRAARGSALANAEAVGPLFVAIDQLGKLLNPDGHGLGPHRPFLEALAAKSPLFRLDPRFHARFESLFDVVRNDATHQGVYALIRTTVSTFLGVPPA